MYSLTDFLGAVTARMIGLMALIATTALIIRVIARAQVPSSSVPQSVSLAILAFLGFGLAMVFLSPKATQRWLRKRRTIFGQLVFSIISIVLVGEILMAAPAFARFIDPSFVALIRPLILLNFALAVAYVLLFLFPGSYARTLAQRHDPREIAATQPSEPADRTWGETFADVAGATLARLIGFVVVLHPIVVLYLHIDGRPRPPLSPTGDVTAAFSLVIAVIFLVPAATRKIFEPLETWIARVVFGTAAIMVLSLVLALSAFSLSELALETGREIYRGLLLSLFESLMILFVLSFIYSSFYVASPQQRRVRRMMMASTIHAHSNSLGSPDDIEPTSGAVGDLQSRLQSYENRRAQTQHTFQPAPPRPHASSRRHGSRSSSRQSICFASSP